MSPAQREVLANLLDAEANVGDADGYTITGIVFPFTAKSHLKTVTRMHNPVHGNTYIDVIDADGCTVQMECLEIPSPYETVKS